MVTGPHPMAGTANWPTVSGGGLRQKAGSVADDREPTAGMVLWCLPERACGGVRWTFATAGGDRGAPVRLLYRPVGGRDIVFS
jgi:hypothetical protein